MPCYYPIAAYKDGDGKVRIGHERRGSAALLSFELPCGQCIGCRLKKAREYAIRCMHEAKLYDENSYITLTYDEQHLPADYSLDHSHFQKFIKRLRKHFNGRTIRYYMCGEYGETTSRPHYHAILFNCGFPDKLYFKTAGGFKLYSSNILNQLWGQGENNLIGDVSLESAGYVARYATKAITGKKAKDHYAVANKESGEIHFRQPPYAKMSLKPGIGAPWLIKHLTDVYPSDAVIVNGRENRPPRYYDKLLERLQTDDMSGYIQKKRYDKAQKGASDNTNDKLKIKERITYANLKNRTRNLP